MACNCPSPWQLAPIRVKVVHFNLATSNCTAVNCFVAIHTHLLCLSSLLSGATIIRMNKPAAGRKNVCSRELGMCNISVKQTARTTESACNLTWPSSRGWLRRIRHRAKCGALDHALLPGQSQTPSARMLCSW